MEQKAHSSWVDVPSLPCQASDTVCDSPGNQCPRAQTPSAAEVQEKDSGCFPSVPR